MSSDYSLKKIFHLWFFLSIVLAFSFNLSAQTITSTTSGGVWGAAASWIGGVVPGAGNNVIINGNIRINGNFTCNNLTINSSCSLMNEYGWNPTLTVNGKITNNGQIIKNPSGFNFFINLFGDVENNGIWIPQQTTLSGTADQKLKQSEGKSFQGYFLTTDTIGQVILESNIVFTGNTWDLNKSKIQANGHTFTAQSCQLNNGTFISDNTLILDNTGISAINFTGNYSIDGNVLIQDANIANGTMTVLDTLMNKYGWNPTLTVNGKIVNNGNIISNPGGFSLFLNLLGDAENNGLWAPRQTTLSGTADQKLKQSEGKSFQGYFLTTDTIGQIILESNIVFTGNTWDLNKSKIQANGHTFTAQSCQLNNGTFISDNTLILDNTGISAINFTGNYSIDGNVLIQDANVANGTMTVLDTLMNKYGWNPTLTVNGKIVNNGYIISNPGGFSLYLNLLGDAENNGLWAPRQTTFSGTADQKLKQSEGKSFQGYFLTSDTIGQVIMESDIAFTGNTWDLNKSKIQANGHTFAAQSCQLNNGTFISDNTLVLNNTGISAINFTGNYSIDGNVLIQDANVANGTMTVLDTLMNKYGWNPTLTVNGKIVNNGNIISNPGGYSLYLNLLGDAENNGLWAPRQTTLSGTANQKLKQSEAKSFQGYFLTSDTIGQVIMESDIAFAGNTWDLNKSKIQANGHNFTAQNGQVNNGTFISNDTLVFNNTGISAMNFTGDFSIDGNVLIQDGNVANGTMTVLDTLMNKYGWNPLFTVNGNLINQGTIINNPSGYNLNFSIKGDIENNNIFRVNNVYIDGATDRTISGRNAIAISGNFFANDSVKLVNENFLPNLSFTNAPSASCTVIKGAVLNLSSVTNSSRIINSGRITVASYIDTNSANTYNYYAASLNTKPQATYNKITVDNYGYQQHPTVKGAVNTWWRLRNSPQSFNDSLNWLKLSYNEDALNGNIEDSIQVYHSPNAGLNWKRIKKGITIDKTNNWVTINNAPAFGHYVLASSSLGITNFQPLVESAEPRFGGNTGMLTMYFFGAGFKATTTAILRLSGQNDIKSDTTWLTDAIGESMLAKFNLKNKAEGIYDIVVETPGENTITLPAYFTIEKGERSNPWSTLTGRDRFLINRWQTFNISYGNNSNTDALGTILVFAVNDIGGLEVEFPDMDIVLPENIAKLGSDYTRFKDIGLYYTTDSLSGYENQKMRVYPFYIPYIPAGSSNMFRVRVKLTGTGSLIMDSWILDPLFEDIDYNLKSAEPMPNEVRLCITAAAMHAFANGATGLLEGIVPGAACWGVIDKTLDPAGYFLTDDMKPEGATTSDGKATWGSWLWNGVSIMASAVQCGASFVPGIGTATSLGIGLVNMAVDIKDGSDATEGCWRKFRKKSQGKLNSRGVTSFDPNEKVGPQGYTSGRYISKEGNINYTIYFENKKTAGAPALEVFVNDTLNLNQFDIKTFSFSRVTFGDTTIKIQEFAKEFQVLADLYPQKNIIVKIHGKLDTITGVVSWDFHSLDRVTLELTEDPDMGFLPPNVNSPEGEGNVTYSCRLKNTVEHGEIVGNSASIVFDLNPPITTNIYTNRIDDKVPVSSVETMPAIQKDTSFTVSWGGSDSGSQIEKYNIFVSANDSTYILWKVAGKEGNSVFAGKNGFNYKFISIASDSIGFSENMKLSPDAVTTVNTNTSAGIVGLDGEYFKLYPNPAQHSCWLEVRLTSYSRVGVGITDISGKNIITKKEQIFAPGQQTIELLLGGITEGMYIVKLSVNEKSYYRKLFIKNY